MKNFKASFLGLDATVYNLLSQGAKRMYSTELIGLGISIFMATSIAIELNYAISDELKGKFLVPSILTAISLIGAMDLILLRSRGNTMRWFRLIFSIALVSMTSTSVFLLISRGDVKNHLAQENLELIKELETKYEAAKKERYASFFDSQEEQKRYHREICEPEARNIRADKEYEKKHRHCQVLIEKNNQLEQKLNDEEAKYKDTYEKQLNREKKETPGFFESVQLSFLLLSQKSWVVILTFVFIFILLLGLEGIVFFMSWTTVHDEYDRLFKLHLKLNEETSRAYLEESNKTKKLFFEMEEKKKRIKNETDLKTYLKTMNLLEKLDYAQILRTAKESYQDHVTDSKDHILKLLEDECAKLNKNI